MKPFEFRLEPVRRLRQSRRDELRGELGAAFQAAGVLAEQRRLVQQELDELRELQKQRTAQRTMDVSLILDTQRYELVLQSQDAALREKEAMVEQEIERRRQAVAQAEREVRTLDKLEERQQAAYQLESSRLEAKQMDETAAQGFTRRNTAHGSNLV